MNVTVDLSRLSAAPAAVKAWFAEELGLGQPKAESPPTSSTAPPATPEVVETAAAPPAEMVMNAAKDFLLSKGEDALQEVLKQIDVPRVREIPEEKRAEFLAAVALMEA